MRHHNYTQLLAATVVAAGLITSSLAAVKVGETFPDLGGYKLDGTLPGDLKGKVVVVDFWASWCGPCKESFPAMNELQKKYGSQGLVIIAVNQDEKAQDMQDFLKDNAAVFTVVRDAGPEGKKLVDKVEIETMPSSFVLDREGKVRYTHSGFHGDATKKEYEQQIESLLK
jgi:cytochrome c biogenesis protein CcmG, thiol:disulfide interchange protein DsbE